MRHWILFKTIFKKEWIDYKRYPFNMISSIITVYLVFLVFFLGLKFIAGGTTKFGSTTEGLIVGFFIWTYAISAYSSLSWSLMNEARAGTLEQLYMCPLGFGWVSIFLIISDFFLSLIFAVPLLFLMMLTTGKFLHLDVITLFPLIVLTISAGYGIGFISGGFGLIYKKIQAFFQILQFVFIGFISAPVDKAPILKILPFSLGTRLIAENMIGKVPIYRMPLSDLFLLFANAVIYMGLGMLIFKQCEKIAKKRGLLGHY